MSETKIIDILAKNEFYNSNFTDLKLENTEFANKIFENCKFSKCNFNEAKFTSCEFIDCEFSSCNLNLMQVKYTAFSEVVFDECKLAGVNWTQAKWPLIRLNSPVKFYRSNISHSSFYSLDLKEIVIEDCKAHDVDFREGNFSNGNFMQTDLEDSLFLHTKLSATTFKNALNYQINPNENDIRKATFSMPDVLNLLYSFQIQIK